MSILSSVRFLPGTRIGPHTQVFLPRLLNFRRRGTKNWDSRGTSHSTSVCNPMPIRLYLLYICSMPIFSAPIRHFPVVQFWKMMGTCGIRSQKWSRWRGGASGTNLVFCSFLVGVIRLHFLNYDSLKILLYQRPGGTRDANLKLIIPENKLTKKFNMLV